MKVAVLAGEEYGQEVGDRIRHCFNFLPRHVDVEYHVWGRCLRDVIRRGRVFEYPIAKNGWLLKRQHIRKEFVRAVKENIDADVVLYSSPSTILCPVLKHFDNTVLDLRDIYQEWTYQPWKMRFIRTREQKQGMKHASQITYTHPGFEPHMPAGSRYITNGANGRLFHPKGPMVSLGDEKKIHFVYIGSMDPIQYTDIWLYVFENLPSNFHLTMIGAGSDRKRLEAKGLKNVTFLDPIWQIDIPAYLRSADYALASTNPENPYLFDAGRHTKAFEALLTGTPVIAYSGRGMAQLGVDTGGSVRTFQMYHTLLRMMEKLKKTPPEIRVRVRALSEQYNYENIASEFQILFEEMTP